MPHTQHNPQALARDVASAMWERDRATQALDMQIVRVGPGEAVISMPVSANMLNGHQTCHGGYIFTLADSAFAYACNSHNQNTVAAAAHIDFLAPAHEGDVLEAEAVERSLAGRTGVYDVTVRIRGGKTCALFRGKSYRVSGEVIQRGQPEGQSGQHN
ncbi:MAG: hydroxyphenylacetyl-CoA thioesterase PaaI [Allorhizobium sp.]|jgi:acyl-CoA thioesterase|nr:hydroxyphenylacetyl-CoA thioesterase PaaI [Burkholderiaceae bacterium]